MRVSPCLAEEAVNEVKRQAMAELQKAVSEAERKAHDMITSERAKMERTVAEAKRQAAEDALAVINQQEDSSEVRALLGKHHLGLPNHRCVWAGFNLFLWHRASVPTINSLHSCFGCVFQAYTEFQILLAVLQSEPKIASELELCSHLLTAAQGYI